MVWLMASLSLLMPPAKGKGKQEELKTKKKARCVQATVFGAFLLLSVLGGNSYGIPMEFSYGMFFSECFSPACPQRMHCKPKVLRLGLGTGQIQL